MPALAAFGPQRAHFGQVPPAGSLLSGMVARLWESKG